MNSYDISRRSLLDELGRDIDETYAVILGTAGRMQYRLADRSGRGGRKTNNQLRSESVIDGLRLAMKLLLVTEYAFDEESANVRIAGDMRAYQAACVEDEKHAREWGERPDTVDEQDQR